MLDPLTTSRPSSLTVKKVSCLPGMDQRRWLTPSCRGLTTAELYPVTGGRRRRRPRLATLRLVRLVREGTFPAPAGYPEPGVPVRSPRDVFALMQPYAERE